MARERIELNALVVAPPPRAITEDVTAAFDVEEDVDGEGKKSVCRPVLMKKSAENAMARLTNLVLNCSLFDTAVLTPRIFCEILENADWMIPRPRRELIDAILSLSSKLPPASLVLVIDSRVLVVGVGGVGQIADGP